MTEDGRHPDGAVEQYRHGLETVTPACIIALALHEYQKDELTQ